MFSINSTNNVPPLASAGSSNEISESNGFAGEVASTSDRSTLPETTSASDRSETSLLYGSALESFEPIEERRDFVQTFKDNYEALTVHTTPHLTENGFLRFPHDAAPFFSDAILESFTNNETSEDLTQKERMDFVKTFKDNYEALTAPTNEKGSLRLTRGSETVVAGTIAEALEPIDNGEALTARTNEKGSLRLTRGSETVVAGTIAEALEPIDNGAALTTRTNNETPRDLIWRGERDRHLRYIAALKELLKH
jgi:hypothetical protein